jgi:hypothetical protein
MMWLALGEWENRTHWSLYYGVHPTDMFLIKPLHTQFIKEQRYFSLSPSPSSSSFSFLVVLLPLPFLVPFSTYISYGLDDWGVGVRVPVGWRIFPKSSRPVLGPAQPPIQWVPGAFSPEVKWPGREADYSPPASAEVKKIWIYTSTPPYAFMA